jgi:CRP-like cAMP-binding protein
MKSHQSDSGLIDAIRSIYKLEDQLLRILLNKIELVEFPARYKLFKEGNVARKIYLVQQGALRSFYLKNGNEITTWFTFEGEFITSFYSLISNSPSYESIELLEDSLLYGLSFEDLNLLTQQYPEINQLYRRVLEINFVKQEKMLAERFDNATEKYQDLISNYPHILQRVPLGYIASYLGINQSTLSRIRSK